MADYRAGVIFSGDELEGSRGKMREESWIEDGEMIWGWGGRKRETYMFNAIEPMVKEAAKTAILVADERYIFLAGGSIFAVFHTETLL